MIKTERHSGKQDNPQLYILPAKLLRILPDQMLYIGKGLSQADIVCMQSALAAKPISASCSIYYYEVAIISAGNRTQIYVGLTDKSYEMGKPPGTVKHSFALRLDGKLFKESSQGETYCQAFATGDVAGCGFDFEASEIFFTRNGSVIGKPIRNVQNKEYFAIVAMSSPKEAININFGQRPFLYDIDERASCAAEARQATILTYEVPYLKLQDTIHFYLMHMGYTQALREFDTAAGINTEDKMLKRHNKRRKLSDLITPSVQNECAQCGERCSGSMCDSCIVVVMRNAELDAKPTIPEPKKGIRRAGSFDWGTLFLKADDENETSVSSKPEAELSAQNLKMRGEVRAAIMSDNIGGAISILQNFFPAYLSQWEGASLPALYVLRFGELVSKGHLQEALEFARSSLVRFRYHRIPLADGTKFQVRLAMGLLCYSEPLKCPLQYLFSTLQRDLTADLVNSALLELERNDSINGLEALVKQLVVSQTALRELYTRSKEDSITLAV